MLHFAKCGIWKGFMCDLEGHSRSLVMAPFDRPHMISY